MNATLQIIVATCPAIVGAAIGSTVGFTYFNPLVGVALHLTGALTGGLMGSHAFATLRK